MIRPSALALHYRRIGPDSAPAVLFLHGITESHRYFASRLAGLAGPFHLVLPDLPGFGLSPKPVVSYRIDLFVDAIRAFVEEGELSERPLHLVGHSLGAILALEYAARYPEQVGRIVLLSLPRFSDPETAREIFWSGSPSYRKLLQQHSLKANLSQLRRTGLVPALRNAWGIPLEVLSDCRLFTFQSLTSTLENCLLNHSVEPALDRAPHVPTLLLHGEKDQVAPFHRVAELPREHPHMLLRSFPSGGHHVLHTHAGDCGALIRSHLSS
ncbi:MAG: hypothetical protein DMF49_10420 [Acidobacteria bacterium]|nr:MAG: hypothetical protein DMF49_10420 [Acidobacteriota bacterium]